MSPGKCVFSVMLYTVCRKRHCFGTCCQLCLLLGRKGVHCSVANQLAERSRLRVEQCEEARHRCWTPAALSPNVLLVADGVRCCFKTGLHWAVLRRAGVKVDSRYYREVLLKKQMLPVMRRIAGDTYMFQQHSAPAHRARETFQLLQQETPQFISPDL